MAEDNESITSSSEHLSTSIQVTINPQNPDQLNELARQFGNSSLSHFLAMNAPLPLGHLAFANAAEAQRVLGVDSPDTISPRNNAANRLGVSSLEELYGRAIPPIRFDPRGVQNQPKQEPRKTVVTLASALPKTPYSDRDDTQGSERSLAYVRVQRSVLKYLESNASDSLVPVQARRWTEAIEPRGKKPKAVEALRLCYYMRSQGYDTYADLKNGTISLFVMNALSKVRHEKMDHLYWKQDFKTDVVDFRFPLSDTRYARRNAIAGHYGLSSVEHRLLSNFPSGDFLSFQPRGQTGATGAEQTRNAALYYAGLREESLARTFGTPHQGGPASNSGGQLQTTLDALCAAAEAELNNLLNQTNQSPAAIQAALRRVEELQRQASQMV